jgi:hypothetical protein
MSGECTIEFRQNGNNVDIDVEMLTPPLGRTFRQVARPTLQLNATHMDQLRGGNAQPAVIRQIIDDLSQWLMQNDLDLPLLLDLDRNPPPDWRLIFSIEKIRDEALRHSLSELPLELLEAPGRGLPLALYEGVRAMVHRLPKMGSPPPPGTSSNWPFRVLIVRANPADLGGRVPPAEDLRRKIFQAAGLPPGSVNGLVRIDVLSSEQAQGLAGKPTADQLSQQVVQPYDMLVYLGHGDLQPSPTGGPDLGVLLLETDDGQKSKQLDARRLSALLNANPIPVVLLVGCLTAAQNGPDPIEQLVPGWIRGSQGVAQALVNGQSGVQFVIGMRFKVENTEAMGFLEGFFTGLLGGPRAGDLEAALQAARRKVHFAGSAIGWAAPVAFRTRGEEPSFPYLANKPAAATIPLEAKTDKARAEFWQMLAHTNWGLRSGGLDQRIRDMLDGAETDYLNRLSAHAAVLMPERKELDPATLVAGGQTRVEVLVHLRSPLRLQTLDALATINAGTLLSIEATPALAAAGVTCLAEPPTNDRIRFLLRSANLVALPLGPILKIALTVPSDTPAVYVLMLEGLGATPAAQVCALPNAVIAAAP